MIKLSFPSYEFRIVEKDGKLLVFDPVRKRFVALTPEEWVRQHVIQFLEKEKHVPLSLIRAESEIRLYKTRKRFDLAVFNRNGGPLLVVECKSPSVAVTQAVLDQVVRYNLVLKVGYLMLTNGLQHIYCQVDTNNGTTRLISELPDFISLSSASPGSGPE
jgi:hypothetical protein